MSSVKLAFNVSIPKNKNVSIYFMKHENRISFRPFLVTIFHVGAYLRPRTPLPFLRPLPPPTPPPSRWDKFRPNLGSSNHRAGGRGASGWPFGKTWEFNDDLSATQYSAHYVDHRGRPHAKTPIPLPPSQSPANPTAFQFSHSFYFCNLKGQSKEKERQNVGFIEWQPKSVPSLRPVAKDREMIPVVLLRRRPACFSF
jgi:hypothetical protein